MPIDLDGSPLASPSPNTPRKAGSGADLPQSERSLFEHGPSSVVSHTVQQTPQNASSNSLLPPFPVERSLPTPHSLNAIPRHMDFASPESPSVLLSSRSRSVPHDGSRRFLLPSPASIDSPLSGRNLRQFGKFPPSPSSISLSPTMPVRTDDIIHETYNVATPMSSPARMLRGGELRTPSSPDHQESFPGTPAHPDVAWEVAHVSSSPVNHHIASRELRIERPLMPDDVHPFVGHARKAPPIIAPPPPPRNLSDDEEFSPQTEPSMPIISQEPTAPNVNLFRDEGMHQRVAGPSRISDEQMLRSAPHTPTTRRSSPPRYRERMFFTNAEEREPPDYLKRNKRVRDVTEGDVSGREEKRHSPGGVGVHVSPTNGRRLRLYQPSTPDSRHPTWSSPNDRKTPSRGLSALSNRARAWLETSSPHRPRTKPGHGKKVDKEARKQRRIAAFRQSEPTATLDAYDVHGRGRILVSPSAAKALLILSNVDSTNTPPMAATPPRPDWPDNCFPWSCDHAAHKARASEEAEAVQEESMKWIEKFLDRDSDDEDSVDDVSSRTPQGSPSRSESVADARTALFSRHEVRRLTEFQFIETKEIKQAHSDKEQNPEDDGERDDEIIRCVCGSTEEDQPMVACDRCSIWFHQECMGIKNSADLDGQEKWYCFDCRRDRTPTPPPPPRQPIFSISSPDMHVLPSLDKPLFQVTSLQRSPGLYPGLDSPSPLRTYDREDMRMTSLLDTPRAPTTPFRRNDRDRDIHIIQTPGIDSFSDEFPPVMPFGTPRGGFSLPNVPFETPTQPPRKQLGLPVTPKPRNRVTALENSTTSPLERFAYIAGETTGARMQPRDYSPTPGTA